MKPFAIAVLGLLVVFFVEAGNAHTICQTNREAIFCMGGDCSKSLLAKSTFRYSPGRLSPNCRILLWKEVLNLQPDSTQLDQRIRLALTYQEADAMRRGVWSPPPGRCCVYGERGQSYKDWLPEQDCRSMGGRFVPAGPTECGRPDLGP
jgi:hypothetical protein